MSRELFLIRHVEAEPTGHGKRDFERDITSKGYVDATRMGNFLFDKGVRMNLVVSSKALRAQRTAEILSEQIHFDVPKIRKAEELYEASVRTMLALVNNLKVELKSVALIGHNPTIAYFAEYITGEPIDEFPPGAVVQINFDLESWHEVGEGIGSVMNFYQPDQI